MKEQHRLTTIKIKVLKRTGRISAKRMGYLHGIPHTSLAEVAHASMKAGNENNLPLVHAVYADIFD